MKSKALRLLKGTCPRGQEFVYENLLFLGLHGSQLYGTNTHESDFDYLGVTMPEPEHVFGLKRFEQYERTFEPEETNDLFNRKVEFKIYDFRKFIKLAMGMNPNINEILYAPERNMIVCGPVGSKLIRNRDMFVSLKCYNTFCGYARSQEHKLLTKTKNKTGRVELVDRHGFDTKFLMHLFRLYYEVMTLLKEGSLSFPLPNRRRLMDIREGLKYGSEDLETALKDAKKLEENVNELYTRSDIPKKPDYRRIEEFQIKYLWEHLKESHRGHYG
jgi:predicted nucleotidyltransferase